MKKNLRVDVAIQLIDERYRREIISLDTTCREGHDRMKYSFLFEIICSFFYF